MKYLIILMLISSSVFGTLAVICYRAERMMSASTSCQNSVFQLCETIGIRRACDHQLRQPTTWRRGMSVYEACRQNHPPPRYTAIGTFLQEHDRYPRNYQQPHFRPHSALFVACGAWNSIVVLDQHTDNRTYSVWGTNTFMDRGHEISESNARMYHVIERTHSNY